MENFVLNHSEKKLLRICLKYYRNKDLLTWKVLRKESGLSDGTIGDFGNKFKRLGYLLDEKGYYNINPKLTKELKELLEKNREGLFYSQKWKAYNHQ